MVSGNPGGCPVPDGFLRGKGLWMPDSAFGIVHDPDDGILSVLPETHHRRCGAGSSKRPEKEGDSQRWKNSGGTIK